MRKISQVVATKIAKDMVAKTVGKKIAEINHELYEEGSRIALNSINPKIKAFNEEFPSLCYKASTIQLCSDGLSDIQMNIDSFPYEKGWKKMIEVSRETYDSIWNRRQEVKRLEDEELKLRNQIYKTLIHLSTPKRIQSDFPEAYELLEAIIKEEENQKCTVVALPIDEIKNSLLKYKD